MVIFVLGSRDIFPSGRWRRSDLQWFGTRTSSCIYNMFPIPLSTWWQLLPPLDQKDTCIAYFTRSPIICLEATFKFWFIFLGVCKPWWRWLRSTNTTSIQGPVDLWLMKTEHVFYLAKIFQLHNLIKQNWSSRLSCNTFQKLSLIFFENCLSLAAMKNNVDFVSISSIKLDIVCVNV